jgi:chloramphenicol 3-O phosphotransferase
MTGHVYSLAALVRAGCDVVSEALIIPERLPLYRDALRDIPVLLVGVRCSLDVAAARERARTDRTPEELDALWFDTIHQLSYDAEVDTSANPPVEALALRLLRLYASPPESRAFSKL